MIYRESGFLAVVWFGSSPTPFPPLHESCLSFSVFLCVAVLVYWRTRWGEGLGEEPFHTTASKPGPLLSFNTLCGDAGCRDDSVSVYVWDYTVHFVNGVHEIDLSCTVFSICSTWVQILKKNFADLMRSNQFLSKEIWKSAWWWKRMRIFGADVAPDKIRFGQ